MRKSSESDAALDSNAAQNSTTIPYILLSQFHSRKKI